MVEVPSHTLEHFASDPRVLSLFARHRATGEGLPPGLLEQLEASKRRFAALEQQQQVRGGGMGRTLTCVRCAALS
jgi:intermediate peptidase